jgi:hypothetical protein
MPHAWQLFARLVPEGPQALERIGAFVQRHMERAGPDVRQSTLTASAG